MSSRDEIPSSPPAALLGRKDNMTMEATVEGAPMPKTPIHHHPTVPDGVVPVQHHRIDQPSSRTRSLNFITGLSIVLGIVIACGVIVGGLGRAFFVAREEYQAKIVKDTEEKTSIGAALDRIGHTLSRQEAAFDKMSQEVQSIRIDMAKKR